MLEDDLFDNREPDSRAGFAGLFGFPGPVEFLKNVTNLFLIHADTLVFDGDLQPFAVTPPKHRHSCIRRRVLDGIRQQVVKGILHQLAVAGQQLIRECIHADSDLLSLSQRRRSVHATCHNRPYGKSFLPEFHFARREAFDV